MPRHACYFAQPFWRDRKTAALRYEFRSATDAEEGAVLLLRGSADGVLVYRQEIEGQALGDIEVISIHGEVPRAALLIDDDGREPWMDDQAA